MKQFSNLTIVYISIAFVVLLFFLITPISVFADSSYVLPYPSAMPGSKLYRINLVKEKVLRYWYFGNFGQFKYSLKQSDKYLVEAKILFEYKQYLLAFEALRKSDVYFQQTLPNLVNAQKERKNINANRDILREASGKHIEILSEINKNIPANFVWTPEKGAPTTLNLSEKIKESIKTRKKYL
ncbi:MAG: hypothetical protein HYT06_02100 [Candidatus Levybacteria bacterium]|nr:hypothetical protein [Candidatus Levybacteria bacterium]